VTDSGVNHNTATELFN